MSVGFIGNVLFSYFKSLLTLTEYFWIYVLMGVHVRLYHINMAEDFSFMHAAKFFVTYCFALLDCSS